jgi:hypothetical protein
MTELTGRELLDTILRSWMATRASFTKAARPPAEDEATLQPNAKEVGQLKEHAGQGGQ